MEGCFATAKKWALLLCKTNMRRKIGHVARDNVENFYWGNGADDPPVKTFTLREIPSELESQVVICPQAQLGSVQKHPHSRAPCEPLMHGGLQDGPQGRAGRVAPIL